MRSSELYSEVAGKAEKCAKHSNIFWLCVYFTAKQFK